jgi:acylphosphatase
MAARRLSIAGHVHNVGFRDWMVAQARALGLNGWVRNRADGTVEALIDGPEPAVEEMLRACRFGPRSAVVESIVETLAEPPAELGFQRLPTA